MFSDLFLDNSASHLLPKYDKHRACWKRFSHLSSLLPVYMARAQNTLSGLALTLLDMLLVSSEININYLAMEAELEHLLVSPLKILLLLRESKT